MGYQNKRKTPDNVQPLSKTKRIAGITFTIDMDGHVHSTECGPLGHIEECIEVAETLSTLFDIASSME